MISPNKAIKFKESSIYKMLLILDKLKEKDAKMKILDLYSNLQGHFSEVNEFIIAVDVLFILDAICFDKEKSEIAYVKRNTL